MSDTKNYILVIVESPAKIQKLESFLGKGYIVCASFGHIIDLLKKCLSIDIENNFTPTYDIIKGEGFLDKTSVVANLKKLYKNANSVIFASDDDREGEMIAWSCKQVLNIKNNDKYKRITFNSITKEAVLEALKNPKTINDLKVDSQKARRMLDRICGYKISPIISKILGTYGLSAGRVQSVVVRMICDKEKEIEEFFNKENSSFYKINGKFKLDKIELSCVLKNNNKEEEDSTEENINEKIEDYKTALNIIKDISKSTFKIDEIIMTNSIRKPSQPFITSTIQQEASNIMSFNVKRTMSALQNLYEAGHITYMRTDSPILSNDAILQCKNYIIEKWGKENYNKVVYKSKNDNSQEAHEAIRPVKIMTRNIEKNGKIKDDEIKMYNLVWNRTVASQMVNAEINVYNIYILISKLKNYRFLTKLEEITKLGFMYVMTHKIPKDIIVKELLKKNTNVLPIEVLCDETFKNPPLRYTEGSLIKKMESMSIGRPATYAQTISTIQEKYVNIKDFEGIEKDIKTISWINNEEIKEKKEKTNIGKEKNKFSPTDVGRKVNEIMLKYFPDIMKYEFTAEMEKQLDEIMEGKKTLLECLKTFWSKLEPSLNSINLNDDNLKVKHIVGIHPETNKEIIGLLSTYGAYLKMENEDGEFITAPIKGKLKLETITLNQALELLKYPKLLGTHENKKVYLKTGMYGFYIEWNKIKAPLNKNYVEGEEIDFVKILQDKKIKDDEKQKENLFFKKEGTIEYSIRKGEKNNYIMVKNTKKPKDKPLFVNLPKDIDNNEEIKTITIEKIKDIVKEYKPKKKFVKKT